MDASQPDACHHAYLIARVAVCCHCEQMHVLTDGGDPAEAAPLLARLMPRQREIVRLLDRGCSHAAVAHDLGISYHTVTRLVADMHRRLGAQSRTEVLLMYRGVLPLRDTTVEPLGTERAIEQAPAWRTAYHGPNRR